MTPSRSSTTVDDRNTDELTPHGFRARLRVSLAATVATAIVAIGLLSGAGKSARGDDKASSPPKSSAPDQPTYRAFISKIQQALRKNDDRLIGLASPIVEKAEASDQLQDQLAGAESRVRSAEVRYHVAQLEREVAQTALDEYQKVTYVQEKATVESEIQWAEAELEDARKAVPEAKERLARIKALMTDKSKSNFNREMEDRHTAHVASLQVLEQKSETVLEAAESKKKVLEEYTQGKVIKELKSEVERARFDALAKQATWELEKTKLNAVKRMTKRSELPDIDQRILSLVQRAYPIQAAIEAKRDQLVKGGKPDPALQTALRDLTNQLEALVDQAEREWATTRFAELKRQVRVAAGRSSRRKGASGLFGSLFSNNRSRAPVEAPAQTQPDGAGPEPASLQRLVVADPQSLNGVYVRLIGLTERALKVSRSSQLLDQLANLRVATESAKANYQNAKLTRQVAEIAITEYTEGIFKQDLATLDGGIRLARSDLQRGQDVLEFGKAQLARSKEHEAKSVSDLHRLYQLVHAVAESEQENRNRANRLQQLETKKKLLVDYTKPKRLKELEIAVEKARAEELTRQAAREIAKVREACLLEKMIQREDPATDHKPVLALIERAMPIEEQVRGKLAQLAKAEKSNDLLPKEIQDLTNALRAIVEEAETVWSAGELARLKPRIEAVTRRADPAAAK